MIVNFDKHGQPIFGNFWQRLWWGLGCYSCERRETAHYIVNIYWRVKAGSLESFSLASPKRN